MIAKIKDKIKVFLVDDHPIVRSGIRSELLKVANIDIVGEASNGKEAIEKAGEINPHVILMDISMPDMNGLEATTILRKKLPKIKIIALSMHDNKNYVMEMIRLGASGYVMKDSSPEELIEAIESVYSDNVYYSRNISESFLKDFTQRIKKSKKAFYHELLTPREREILIQLANGLSNKKIAEKLFVSVRTVEAHREKIMQKLNLKNLAALTKYAIEEGLVNLYQ